MAKEAVAMVGCKLGETGGDGALPLTVYCFHSRATLLRFTLKRSLTSPVPSPNSFASMIRHRKSSLSGLMGYSEVTCKWLFPAITNR